MTTTTTLPSIAEDAARRVYLEEQKDRIQQEIDQINDRLRTNDFGNHDAGDWTLTVRHNRRLDAKRLEQRYPVAQYPQYYKPTIDTSAIKQYLAPIELEQFQVEGAPTVVIR